MPLSEREQRLLEEMERNLYGRDADFVSASPASVRPNYRAIVFGVVIVIVGLGVILSGVMISQPIVGIAGFGVMLLGGFLALKPGAPAAGRPANQSSTSTAPRSGFMDRMNERWDRRHQG